MREPLVWGRGVRSYEDLVRAYADRSGLSSQQESVAVLVEGVQGSLEPREP